MRLLQQAAQAHAPRRSGRAQVWRFWSGGGLADLEYLEGEWGQGARRNVRTKAEAPWVRRREVMGCARLYLRAVGSGRGLQQRGGQRG